MSHADAESLLIILMTIVPGVVLGIVSALRWPRSRVWTRGWLIAARGVLRGLWRSVVPFASSGAGLGRQRGAQGSCGTLRARRTELLAEQTRLHDLNVEVQRLERELEHRIHVPEHVPELVQDQIIQAFSVPPPVVGRRVRCLSCFELVTEIAMPHACSPHFTDLTDVKYHHGSVSLPTQLPED
ncbi:MAG TPA: hypothetical protein VGD39_12285 [Nocardioides sp.]